MKRYQRKLRLKEMVLSIGKTEVYHFHVGHKITVGKVDLQKSICEADMYGPLKSWQDRSEGLTLR